MRHSIGLDFARIIRSMLRQAPNIILVGEMRDAETAQMGIQASLTGHLVFSTLHTNDAPGAITRMVDMGVPAYLVASSVIAVVGAASGARRLHQVQAAAHAERGRLGGCRHHARNGRRGHVQTGQGLRNCQKSGYRGRLGIFELMLMTSKIRELAFQGASTQDIRRAAIGGGMTTLYDDGIRKVLRGITTLEEVMRVAKRTEH